MQKTETRQKNENLIFFLFAFLLIVIDQVTKLAVKGFHMFGIDHKGLAFGDTIRLIGDFLQVTYVENEGMAFGISFGAWKLLLSLFSIIAGAALGYYLYKLNKYSAWVRLGVALILAGAVGNLVDRVFYGVLFGDAPLFYGRVVDFLLVDIPDINFLGLHYTHWPVFNVADSCVTLGVIVLLLFHNRIPSFEQVFGRKKDGKSQVSGSSYDLSVKKENEL
jgi:signal peptidase II